MGRYQCCACGLWCSGKRLVVTEHNLTGLVQLFKATGRKMVAPLAVGGKLCQTASVVKGPSGPAKKGAVKVHTTKPPCCSDVEEAALQKLMIGKPVSHILTLPREKRRLCDGQIVKVVGGGAAFDSSGALLQPEGFNYEAVFKDLPGGEQTITFTQEEAEAACEMHILLAEREEEARVRGLKAAHGRYRRAAKREAEAEAEAAELSAFDDELLRALSWKNLMSEEWWERYGSKVSPRFHSSLFGFKTPKGRRAFFETFFEEEAADDAPKVGALGNYELYTLGLMRGRTDFMVQFVAALAGEHRGRVGSHTGDWILKLGAVGRGLVGIPEFE